MRLSAASSALARLAAAKSALSATRRRPTSKPLLAACRTFATGSTLDAAPTIDSVARPARYDAIELDLCTALGARAAASLSSGELTTAVARWRRERRSSVWLRLPMSSPHFVAAHAAGFSFHHAEGATAMLTIWLQDGVPNVVPPFATTQVGVAGVVIDARQRILVVKDRGKSPVWKFPGGLSNRGESIGACAEREVLEETGVYSRFRSLLSFRHQHANPPFGVSDLYFLCLCDALSDQITLDPVEILDAKWVDAATYVAETDHPLNRWVAAAALRAATSPAGDAGTMAEEEVFIPVTGRHVKAYRSAGGPPINGHQRQQL